MIFMPCGAAALDVGSISSLISFTISSVDTEPVFITDNSMFGFSVCAGDVLLNRPSIVHMGHISNETREPFMVLTRTSFRVSASSL